MPPDRRSELAPAVHKERGAHLVDLLVSTTTDYAIFALEADGRIATWNPGAARISGYDAGEIIGCHVSAFYLPEDVEAGKPDTSLAIAVADGQFEEEGWRLRKDGSTFWASVVITSLRDTDGSLAGFGQVT